MQLAPKYIWVWACVREKEFLFRLNSVLVYLHHIYPYVDSSNRTKRARIQTNLEEENWENSIRFWWITCRIRTQTKVFIMFVVFCVRSWLVWDRDSGREREEHPLCSSFLSIQMRVYGAGTAMYSIRHTQHIHIFAHMSNRATLLFA